MFEGINGAIQVAIIDMVIVFLVLGGLALIIVSLKNIVGIKEEKKISKEVKIVPPASDITSIKEKEEVDGKITSNIKLLDENERIVELAEMLGGKDLTDSAIAHAKQLLN